MQDKVHLGRLGDSLEVESGGVITLKAGARLDLQTGSFLTVDGAAPAALTAQLTSLTIADAAGTPDYSIAAVTNSTPYGFSNAAEAITLLYVVKNLQTRCAELEARLEAAGLVTAN
jgi:hypothetical protein